MSEEQPPESGFGKTVPIVTAVLIILAVAAYFFLPAVKSWHFGATTAASPKAPTTKGPSPSAKATPSSKPLPSRKPTTKPPAPSATLSGTWVLQQALTASDVDNRLVEAALSTPGVRGFSLRVPWTSIDGNTALLDAGARTARAHHLALSIRFMAGRWTPQRVFDAGSPFYTVNGAKVPTPFSATGKPNTVFEAAYNSEVKQLAAWSRANGVHLLHLPWYGQDWAELNFGKEVRAAPGYSYQAWLVGHERLFNIGLQYSSSALSIEFPLSGYGPLVQPSGDLARYVAQKAPRGPNRAFIQANGLNEIGDWGSSSPTVEVQMQRAVWPQPVARGEQMIQTVDYNWDLVYARLRVNGATYIEVYVQSFSSGLAHHAALLRNIAAFR